MVLLPTWQYSDPKVCVYFTYTWTLSIIPHFNMEDFSFELSLHISLLVGSRCSNHPLHQAEMRHLEQIMLEVASQYFPKLSFLLRISTPFFTIFGRILILNIGRKRFLILSGDGQRIHLKLSYNSPLPIFSGSISFYCSTHFRCALHLSEIGSSPARHASVWWHFHYF